MIKSHDKGINDTIRYNFLNMPEILDFGSGEKIRYIYDAAGNKLAKIVIYLDALPESSLIYAGNFVYDWNGNLQYIQTSEGRLVPDNKTYRFEYFMKDHLGNTRATYAQAAPGLPQTAEYNHYYPFGMQIEALSYSSGIDVPNNLLYNGKELQPEYDLQWYDYGTRFYDPELGRFHTLDAFAEKYFDFTPYQYGANNPVLYIDVNGDSIDVSKMSGKELKVYQAQVSAFKEKSKLFNVMYSSLEESKKVYTVQYGETSKRDDGSMVDGQFVSDEDGGGTVTFLNTNTNSQAFNEELFHAYQNDNQDKYDKGDFNIEFEAKLGTTAIVAETGYGYANIAGMENFQNKVGIGDYGKGNMQITPANVNSSSFLNSYKSAANAYAGYNKINNIGNRHYRVNTTVAPYSLKTMVNKAYGK